MIFTMDDAIPIPVADAVTTELIGLDANFVTAIPAPHGNTDIQAEENATFTIHMLRLPFMFLTFAMLL